MSAADLLELEAPTGVFAGTALQNGGWLGGGGVGELADELG